MRCFSIFAVKSSGGKIGFCFLFGEMEDRGGPPSHPGGNVVCLLGRVRVNSSDAGRSVHEAFPGLSLVYPRIPRSWCSHENGSADVEHPGPDPGQDEDSQD